jgi:hypothetical protein
VGLMELDCYYNSEIVKAVTDVRYDKDTDLYNVTDYDSYGILNYCTYMLTKEEVLDEIKEYEMYKISELEFIIYKER